MRRLFWLSTAILIVSAWMMTACQKGETAVNTVQEKEAVEQAIRNSIGWAKNKDLNVLYGVIADDENFIEVGPGEHISKGFSEFRQAENFWMHPDFKAVGYEIRDLHINLAKGGDVAWFFCMLDDLNTWKGQPANWENTRWTGVLEKRDGHWRMVQMHFSFPTK